MANLYIENYEAEVKFAGGLKTLLPVTLPAATTIGGSSVSALGVVTSASANALAVGLAGATNPAFNVDSSTALQAAGLNVVGAIAAGTVAVAVISSGSNASLTMDAKGSGTVQVGGISTGDVKLAGGGGLVDIRATGAGDGSGSTATLLKVGNTGRPQTTAQSGWLPIKVGGTAAWLPYWV